MLHSNRSMFGPRSTSSHHSPFPFYFTLISWFVTRLSYNPPALRRPILTERDMVPSMIHDFDDDGDRGGRVTIQLNERTPRGLREFDGFRNHGRGNPDDVANVAHCG
jgi:hypothetical protein